MLTWLILACIVTLVLRIYLKLRDRFSERDDSSSIRLHMLTLDCCDRLAASSNACIVGEGNINLLAIGHTTNNTHKQSL